MKLVISQDTIRSPFRESIEKECGKKVSNCYQCGKCSAGCPLSFQMDYLPNQIIRMIQLGMEKQVLSSKTIWLCSSCLTCSSRCPREIDIAEIMDHLRRLAHAKQVMPPEEFKIPLFNKLFLFNIKMFGRLYEMGLIGMFNMFSGEFFQDMSLAPKMFLKRKIGIFPHRAKNMKEVREIFNKTDTLDKGKKNSVFYPQYIFRNLSRKLIGK
jgi:heterodisulfide reductase subunit C2